MPNKNITFIGLGRIRDQVILASAFDRITSQEKNEIETSFHNHLLDALSRFGPGSREKRHFGSADPSTMFMLADRELTCIYALSVRGKSYPERVAYAALAELAVAVNATDEGKSLDQASPSTLGKVVRKPMRDVMDKYDDPANVDKTAEVTGKVDSVKGVMAANITKVLANQQNLESLEEKTDNLNQNAEQFSRSAEDLKRIMWWQKTKMMVLLIIVVIAVLAYIGLTVANYVT